MAKPLKIADLNRIYEEAESADREIFAEMKSNVLLIAGDHYNKRSIQRLNDKIRATQQLTEYQKLRLTKNHTHKIVRHYVANILAYAPGVTPAPKHESNIQSVKSAELNKAVWEDAKHRYLLDEEKVQWCRSFVGLGEVCVMVKYDPNIGELIAYEQIIDEMGQPVLDEMGQTQSDKSKPVFRGGFVFEEIYGFNLLRHAGAHSMRKAVPWIVRKMADKDVMAAHYANDPQKKSMFQTSSKEDFIVFDSDKGTYEKAHNQVMIREFYWPPGEEYPNGYYAITTKDGVVEEDDLPFGVWPFAFKAFDEYPTTARGRSVVKLVRPYQAEINRASSTMALHQVTLGEDKILYQSGTKLAPGALLPGVRGISYQGAPPQVMAGRDGGQFLPYIQAQISEMYDVVMMQEENEERSEMQLEPYTLLFRSLKRQRKFSEYGEKFEQFLIALCSIYLQLAKQYLSDDEVIAAVGRDEQINISEFKNTSPLSYQITLEPREETLETQFGKQLTMNQIMQYAGSQLAQKDIGRLIKNMPFANSDGAFEDFTLDYDNARNDMLQLERGQMPVMGKYEDHKYAVSVLTNRTKKPDYQFLSPEVQEAYSQQIALHEQVIAEQAQALIDAKNEYIPTNGAMIATDLYVPNPNGPDKPAKRVRIPYQALDWLVQKLEAQGQGLGALEDQNAAVLQDVARMRGNGAGSQPGNPPVDSALQNAPGSALGVS